MPDPTSVKHGCVEFVKFDATPIGRHLLSNARMMQRSAVARNGHRDDSIGVVPMISRVLRICDVSSVRVAAYGITIIRTPAHCAVR